MSNRSACKASMYVELVNLASDRCWLAHSPLFALHIHPAVENNLRPKRHLYMRADEMVCLRAVVGVMQGIRVESVNL